MPNRPKIEDEPLPSYAPKELIRMEFGRRLQAELIRRGWNQSELARQAGLHMPNKFFGRDLVSGYIRGRILPGPLHLNALCKALHKEPAELLPSEASASGANESPIKTQDMGNNRVLLQVNQVVDWPVALQVLQTLKGHAPNGKD
jgi:transcriptional regulator with XRE-family HTH domain